MSKRKDKVQTEALTLSEHALAVRVSNEQEYAQMAEFKRAIAQAKKKIGAVLDPIISKAHAAHKEAVAQKKTLLEPLDTADSHADYEMLRYRERLKAQTDMYVASELPFLGEAPVAMTPAIPKTEGVYARKTIKYRVTDIKKVPLEFLTIDNSKICATIKKFGNATNIPGIEVYTEETMVARS